MIKLSKQHQKILDSRTSKHIKNVDKVLQNNLLSAWAINYWTIVKNKLLLKLSKQGKLKNSKYVN